MLGISKLQSSGLQAAYFGAQILSPTLFSVYVLRLWGLKDTFMVGLITYGIGAIRFWPCRQVPIVRRILCMQFRDRMGTWYSRNGS